MATTKILLLLLVAFVAVDGQRQSCATFDGGIDMCRYESHEQMIRKLQTLAARYPHLAAVGSVGKSVQGRDLIFIKISGNATQGRDLLEPMFKYVGNMHGDETLGRQLLIYLAQFLLQNYESNPRVRRLVDTTEIFLMPTMNPDGFARSKEGCGVLNRLFGPSGRRNANNRDLNRDFPKRFNVSPNAPFESLLQGRQPETQ